MSFLSKNFKTTKGTDGSITLLFDSRRAKECCEFAIVKGIKNISLYPGEYVANDLQPLMPLKGFIEGILLDEKVDYSMINLFHNLKFLSLPDNKKNIVDLSSFPHLETLNCDFSTRLIALQNCLKLKSLTIINYRSKDMNLGGLSMLSNLQYLNLVKPHIVTLQGIESLKNLKDLKIFNALKLERIEALQALSGSIIHLEIERCKKIPDYDVLGKLQLLKKIILLESGETGSLLFVNQLPLLVFLSFRGTNILDGNIKPCERINYVSYDNKKHYTHKFVPSIGIVAK